MFTNITEIGFFLNYFIDNFFVQNSDIDSIKPKQREILCRAAILGEVRNGKTAKNTTSQDMEILIGLANDIRMMGSWEPRTSVL